MYDMIQAAMGWTNSHLHAYTVGNTRIGMCFDEHPEGEIDEQTVTVLQALWADRRASAMNMTSATAGVTPPLIEAEYRTPMLSTSPPPFR